MKSQEFYSAINQIDDDLIESAMVDKSINKVIPFRRYAALAACLCIMIVGVLIVNNPSGSDIYINEVPDLMMKSVDVDMMTCYLSQKEIDDYFDEFMLPGQLLSVLMLDKHSKYTFLVDEKNIIYDDTTIFTYRYEEQILELQLSKIGRQYGEIFIGGMEKKVSRIDNQEIMIGSYIDDRMEKEVVEIHKFVAEYKHGNIFIHIKGEGMDEEEFIDILVELIRKDIDE